MYEDYHLEISDSLHHFLVKDLINHQHFSHSFLLSHSNIALL